MIVIRNTFQLKFGKAKEAKAIVLKIREIENNNMRMRVLSDITGPFYTLVIEFEEESLTAWEKRQQETLAMAELRPHFEALYELTVSGHREIMNVI